MVELLFFLFLIDFRERKGKSDRHQFVVVPLLRAFID